MILVTAHEGCEDSPSNTIASVKAGIDAGADVIEVDVRSTKDGVAILSHNSTIETVSGEQVLLDEVELNEILTMERKSLINFEHPEGIVTKLSDILEIIRERNLVLNLDVKDDESIESIVRTVKKHNMLDYVFISGCERVRASFFKKNFPEFQVLLNVGQDLAHLAVTDEDTANRTIYRYASSAGCCGINIPYKFCTKKMVDFMHRRFLPVSVWTVDDSEDMKKYIEMSVFSITTKRPAVLRSLLSRL